MDFCNAAPHSLKARGVNRPRPLFLSPFAFVASLGWLARTAVFAVLAFAASGCTPAIGDACSYATECSATGTRACDTTQPGGYCTVNDCNRRSCPANSVCILFGAREPGCPTIDFATPRLARTSCMAACLTGVDCRAGYVCASPVGLPWAGSALDDDPLARVCLAASSGPAPVTSPIDAAVSIDGAGAADAGVLPVCSPAGPDVPAVDAPIRRADAAAP